MTGPINLASSRRAVAAPTAGATAPFDVRALNYLDQGVCILDAELRIATFNRRFIELLDLPD